MMIKPKRIQPGDTVAVISPSWGGPSIFPYVFDMGLTNLRETFGVAIREYPTARADADYLYRNPKVRAEDVNNAFADPDVNAIFASIGGDDSVRILPYLDPAVIRANPKVIMGFSDTTTLLTYVNQLDIVTFNGPSILAGFAQMRNFPPAFAERLRSILMEPTDMHEYRPYSVWSEGYPNWGLTPYNGETNEQKPNTEGWQWLQGAGKSQGRLFGGCFEVLEFLKGTRFWPAPDFWQDRMLFIETSEDKPTVNQVKWALRNYGMQGVFDKISGLLVGRPKAYIDEEKQHLYSMLVTVVAEEFGRSDIPIVANLDFGHTDPQWVMPLGVTVEVDCSAKTIRLVESAVQ